MIKLTIDNQDYEGYVFEPYRVGQTYLITIQMENRYTRNVTLGDAYANDDELKVKTFTPVIAPGQKGELIFEFSPSESKPEPCDCSWGFKTVVVG